MRTLAEAQIKHLIDQSKQSQSINLTKITLQQESFTGLTVGEQRRSIIYPCVFHSIQQESQPYFI